MKCWCHAGMPRRFSRNERTKTLSLHVRLLCDKREKCHKGSWELKSTWTNCVKTTLLAFIGSYYVLASVQPLLHCNKTTYRKHRMSCSPAVPERGHWKGVQPANSSRRVVGSHLHSQRTVAIFLEVSYSSTSKKSRILLSIFFLWIKFPRRCCSSF